MTIRLTLPAGLGFNDLVRLGGRTFAVQSVRTGTITYRGQGFDVVYVSGLSRYDGPVRHTLLADRDVFATRVAA